MAGTRTLLIAIGFGTFLVNADSYIVSISTPAISSHFGASTEEVSWVVVGYQLASTALLLAFGALGDRLGLKRLSLFGYAVFTAGSALCALSASLPLLVASRVFQAVGASALYALAPALVTRHFPADLRGPAFGALATAAALGISVGTPLGGFVTGYLSWRWAFLINVPFGLAAILIAHRVLPEDSEARAGGNARFDVAGALLSGLALLSLTYGIESLGSRDLRLRAALGSLGIFLVSLACFVLRERQTPHPLFDYSLFRSRSFSYANAANFLCLAYLAGHSFITPFYLMTVRGFETQRAGAVFLLYSLAYMTLAPMAGHLARRVPPRWLCTGGLALGAFVSLGFAASVGIQADWPVHAYLVGLAVVMAGFIPPNGLLAMARAPEGKQGAVSAGFRVIGRVGMTAGVCLFQMTFTAVAGPDGRSLFHHQAAAHAAGLAHAFQSVYAAGAILFALAALSSHLAGDEAPPVQRPRIEAEGPFAVHPPAW